MSGGSVQPEKIKMKGLLIIISAIILLASCRSTRNIQTAIAKKDTVVETTTVVTNKIDTAQLIRDALSRLDGNRVDYTTFSAKVDVDYRGGDDKHYDVNATIRIYKDSLIWASVNAVLGIEAMRVLITKDSVFLLDKLNKTYTARSVDYLQEVTSLPLNLSTLQNLLIGNPVFIDSVVNYTNDNNGTISLLSIGSAFKNLVTINANNNTLVHAKLDDVDITRSRTANLSYDDYETKRGKLFSTKRRISVAEKNKLDITLNFKQVEFDQEVNFPFSVPKNYKRK
jgi:hypothetical protein